MLLVVFTSCIGVSLVKNQGMKNFMLMQEKLAGLNGSVPVSRKRSS